VLHFASREITKPGDDVASNVDPQQQQGPADLLPPVEVGQGGSRAAQLDKGTGKSKAKAKAEGTPKAKAKAKVERKPKAKAKAKAKAEEKKEASSRLLCRRRFWA